MAFNIKDAEEKSCFILSMNMDEIPYVLQEKEKFSFLKDWKMEEKIFFIFISEENITQLDDEKYRYRLIIDDGDCGLEMGSFYGNKEMVFNAFKEEITNLQNSEVLECLYYYITDLELDYVVRFYTVEKSYSLIQFPLLKEFYDNISTYKKDNDKNENWEKHYKEKLENGFTFKVRPIFKEDTYNITRGIVFSDVYFLPYTVIEKLEKLSELKSYDELINSFDEFFEILKEEQKNIINNILRSDDDDIKTEQFLFRSKWRGKENEINCV